MSVSAQSAAVELARRTLLRRRIIAELHPRQREVLRDKSRYKALLCGRRAGKTELVARMIALAMLDSGPNEWVVFGARTQLIAKDLIWSHMQRLNADYALGWKLQRHLGLIESAHGASFRVFGVDKRDEVEKVRGYKIRLACFDEASTYDDLIPGLLKALAPALTDLRGDLVLSGTPGACCVGYWYEATTKDISEHPTARRYALHSWTVMDNPFFPRDPAEMLAEEREENGWTEDDPTYRREWVREWIDDPEALVYAYLDERNGVDSLPEPFDASTWLTTLGVDFGYSDDCGWVVWGSPPGSRDAYALEAFGHSGLLPDEAARITAELYRRYQCSSIEGDGGGLGKPYVAEFNRRWAQHEGIRISYAEKSDKGGAIALYNADLRTARARYLRPRCGELIAEQRKLPWESATKRVEHPAYPNHRSDAALYGWRKHRSYWQKPTPQQPQNAAESLVLERRRRLAAATKAQPRDWYRRMR